MRRRRRYDGRAGRGTGEISRDGRGRDGGPSGGAGQMDQKGQVRGRYGRELATGAVVLGGGREGNWRYPERIGETYGARRAEDHPEQRRTAGTVVPRLYAENDPRPTREEEEAGGVAQ